MVPFLRKVTVTLTLKSPDELVETMGRSTPWTQRSNIGPFTPSEVRGKFESTTLKLTYRSIKKDCLISSITVFQKTDDPMG